MTDKFVIEYLKDNKWSGDVQDAMIEFIASVIKDTPLYETRLSRALLKRVNPRD